MFGLRIKTIALTFVMATIALTAQASAFILTAQRTVAIRVDAHEQPVVHTALSLLQRDLANVLSAPTIFTDHHPQIIVGSINGAGRKLLDGTPVDIQSLAQSAQAFQLVVDSKGRLIIAGSDSYGTAYGIIELTRLLGVSPWEWWADVDPEPRTEFSLPQGYSTEQSPNVSFRGIFVNDEDWGLLPWASTNFEPNDQHAIGPKTTERIFELMLRLRANLYWPPMHECTRPFFLTEGCRELASRYGIFLGSSHCEPMACNAAGEWSVRGEGAYDFVHNHDAVISFWEQRLRETARQPMVYTLGMRGLHDGQMQGVQGIDDQKLVLDRVIAEQRALLARNVYQHVERLPQAFIPYKEVLDAYNAGLQVPDDVTLVWPDDNYGYIRHFPTAAEQARSGGNGVYYHVSYWGRPHDYLWLGTASPFLMYQQLSEAFYHGARRMWILNVGDIKPAEYQISLFMDMAWNLEKVTKLTVGTHLEEFYAETVGRDVARLLSIYMKEHFHLSFQMKPEHLAGTRVEEPQGGAIDWNAVHDLPWSEQKLRHRLSRYDLMQRNIKWIGDSIRKTHPNRADAFYELVEYPIMATIAMNQKYHLAQLARHGKAWLSRENVAQTWVRSDAAHDAIQRLTAQYNSLRGGKWRGIMDASPRNLPVFKPVPHTQTSKPMADELPSIARFYGASYNASSFSGGDILAPVLGLGASIRAMPLPKDCNVTYKFEHIFGNAAAGVNVELHMLPTHPIEAQQRITLSLDGSQPLVLTYETEGRSEEWKQNVLRGYAVIMAHLPVTRVAGEHHLQIGALDDGVVVDEVIIRK